MTKPPQSNPIPAKLPADIAHGYVLLREGRVEEACQFGERLVLEWPDVAAAHAFAAEAWNVRGHYEMALERIDAAVTKDRDPQLEIKRAWLMSRAHRRQELPGLLARLAGEAGNDAQLLWQLGKLYYHHNRFPEAIDLYERALRIKNAPHVRYDLALARFYSGDAEVSEHDLDQLLSQGWRAGTIAYLRSTLRKQRPQQNHVRELESWLAGGAMQPVDEAGTLYALAKEMEDLGDHATAFAHLERGARKRRGALDYDVSRVVAGLQEIMASTSAEILAKASPGHPERGAIFILGMPRTGTTLTERLLLQSGQVANAGELVDFELLVGRAVAQILEDQPGMSPTEAALKIDFEEIGRLYMLDARMMARGSRIFIDKMPANFLYCGLIHKALPAARIIHLVRDPLDTCYAIYKTLFFKAYEFSYDLEELADYYTAYHRLMAHWREIMPDAILDVRYEDLVTDTEAQARRIYDWCGLEWTPEALAVPGKRAVYATASAAQVREPVHSRSVNSSRRHLKALMPLARKLVAAGIMDASDLQEAPDQ